MIAVAVNNIGIEGAQALAGALKINKSLVDVSLNRKSAAHRTVSFVAQNELMLLCVVVPENKIGDAGAAALAEALNVNLTVKRIELACKQQRRRLSCFCVLTRFRNHLVQQ